MKPAETKSLYERACRSRRMDPNQDEAELWHKQLRSYEARDVQAALDAWFASDEKDERGQVKSRFLPTPAELKSLTESAKRRREVDAQTPKDFVAWKCFEKGCGHTCCGYTESLHAKKCPRCGKPMHEMLRERAQSRGAA